MNKSCIVPLGNIIEFQRGFDLPTQQRIDGDCPVISSSGFTGTHREYKCDGENVVTGRYGTIGEVYYYNGKCWPLNTALFVKDFKGNNPKYVYYLLKHVLKVDGKDKSTVPGVDRNVLHMMKVRYQKNLEYQQKIVDTLSLIDKKININNEINETLRQQISLIYHYWFTQFEFLDENCKPFKSSGGKMVWNQNLKREIPEGWSSKSMTGNELLTVIKPGVDEFDTKVYLATGEVNGTSVSAGNEVEYTTRESRANMQPKINTVWFAKMKNSIKHLFLNKEMKTFIDTSILSTGFCGLQCTNESFEYVSSFIAYSNFETIKDVLAHGATQEAVNNDDLSEIYMVIPDEKVLLQYHEITKLSYAQISRNMCENQELEDLRNWILAMLMNGQATVK